MIQRVDFWFRALLSFGIRLYQRTISPLLAPCCRFEPSCSHYALEALQTWPLGRGLWLIFKRLARCQPFCRSGFDPVPPAPGCSGHRIPGRKPDPAGGLPGAGAGNHPPESTTGRFEGESVCFHG